MATGRDDFVIAFRSAFLKKKDKQKFSLLSLILLSIVVIILSNISFKPIQYIKIGVNEIIKKTTPATKTAPSASAGVYFIPKQTP